MSFIFALLLMGASLALFVFTWRRESNHTAILTPFLLFCALEIVSAWPATIYAYVNGFSRDPYTAWVASSAFLAFVAGYRIHMRVHKRRAQLPLLFRDRPYEGHLSELGLRRATVIGMLFLLVFGFVLYQGIPPQIHAISSVLRGGFGGAGIANEMSVQRYEITKAYYFGGEYRGQGALRVFMSIGWPYLLCLSILRQGSTRSRRDRRYWTIMSCVLFLLTFVFVAGDGTRAPFLFAMIYVIAALSIRRRVRIRHYALAASALFCTLLVMSFFSNKAALWRDSENPLREGILSILERISIGNGINNVYVMELIRDGVVNCQWGGVHLQGFLNALPGMSFGGVPYANRLAELISYETTTTFATMTYLGTVYYDFGSIGVVIVYFLMGVGIAFLQALLFSRQKTLANAVLIVMVGVALGFSAYHGIIGLAPKLVVTFGFHGLICAVTRLASPPYTSKSRHQENLDAEPIAYATRPTPTVAPNAAQSDSRDSRT